MLKQRKNPNVSGIKITMFILVLFCFSFAYANDIMQPGGNERIPIDNYNKENLIPAHKYPSRDNTPVPDYEFVKNPETIMTSYYDYMPGSYASFPIRYQADNGYYGHYLTWFARPSDTANRRQYWAYYDADENIVDWLTISTDDVWQGYGGIAIHPATGDCIAAWHEDFETDPKIPITYDDFALLGIPGFWSAQLVIYNDGINKYCWPYLFVGSSPLGDDYVRIYLLTNNAANDPFGNPCEDVRFMYTDVENSLFADLSVILDIENWNETTIFTEWREKSCRPFQAFGIDFNTPGKVAFIGNALWLEGDLGDMPVDEGVFVWESYDYGETWDYANLHSDGPSDFLYLADNIPGFIDNQGNILDVLEVGVYGWHYTALYDSDGNLHQPYMQQYGFTDATGSYYWPHFLPEAQVTWDGAEFTFDEVPEMPGIDPLSGHSVPWEIVTDPFSGELDTLLYVTVGFSMYPGEANIFHENTQKQSINIDNNWLLQMWADGTYVQLAQDGIPEFLPYLEHPIIFISVSSDNGNTWSEPIELTDIYYPDFDFSGQITVYPYVCDQIIDLGDDWGQVYIYYFDDNTFGSTVIQGQPPDDGGQITYCSIKVKFPEPPAVEPDNPNPPDLSLTNYPNPFTSYTHISFSVPKGLNNPSIKIYNIKGQLVKTIVPVTNDQCPMTNVVWDGKDSNNNDVVSGIYLYKLETDNGSITKKMLLIR